jgi:hypothetical protein
MFPTKFIHVRAQIGACLLDRERYAGFVSRRSDDCVYQDIACRAGLQNR